MRRSLEITHTVSLIRRILFDHQNRKVCWKRFKNIQWIHENKNKTFNLLFSDYGDECEGWKLLNQDTFRDFGINIIWAMYAVNTTLWISTKHVQCALYCTNYTTWLTYIEYTLPKTTSKTTHLTCILYTI